MSRGVLRATARASGAQVEMRVERTLTFRDGMVAEIRTVPEIQP